MTEVDFSTWYYGAGSEQKGPFTADQLRALIQTGAITATTLIWSHGMAGWVPLAQSPFAGRSHPAGVTAASYSPNITGDATAVMGFGEAVSSCFRNYANFSGRANRAEFWFFILFVTAGGIATFIADVALFGDSGMTPLNAIFSLAILIPYFAVTARRLHDTDRSGWWMLFALVPLIGAITLIVFLCQKGTEGRNRFDFS